MRRLALLIALAALAGVCVLFYRFTALKPAEQTPTHTGEGEHEAEEHLEIAVTMGRIQRYHQKWWLAGEAGNADLARFYLHEMEESMEEIAEGHVVDEGVDVSAQMRAFGLPVLEKITKKLDADGVEAMHGMADQLANTCTACHASTGHPYIRIQVPSAASFPDQDFHPAK